MTDDVERDVSVLVKTFERPDALRRLVDSIRRYYPRIRILVVDDSAAALDPSPEGVTGYWHLPCRSLGSGPGRNFGLRHVETEYVLVSDDDMVFGPKTDLNKMLATLRTTGFDVVSCEWMDHDPWTSVRRGINRFEGTIDIENGVLVHRYGATRGTLDGLPIFDVVHQFFMARRERLGEDPWEPRMKVLDHSELFLRLKDRGLRCTRLRDVVVDHRPELPDAYRQVREDTRESMEVWRQVRGFDRRVFVGPLYSRRDRMLYGALGLMEIAARRVARVSRRLVRERRIRAGAVVLVTLHGSILDLLSL
jgi:glycosyltransferase involved in cell wall biosynthesis